MHNFILSNKDNYSHATYIDKVSDKEIYYWNIIYFCLVINKNKKYREFFDVKRNSYGKESDGLIEGIVIINDNSSEGLFNPDSILDRFNREVLVTQNT